jgi:hypothetical protein
MKCEEFYEDAETVCDLYDYCVAMADIVKENTAGDRWVEVYRRNGKTYVFDGLVGFGYPEAATVMTEL